MTNVIKILFLAFLAVSVACQEQEDPDGNDISLTLAWVLSVVTTLSLSILGLLAALLILGVKKCIKERTFKIFINMLYSLGCGALVGDAMIHILPDSYSNPDTNFRYVSLIFICAIVFFIVMERLMHLCGLTHAHWGDEQHSHGDEERNKNRHNLQHKHDLCQHLNDNEGNIEPQLARVQKIESDVNLKVNSQKKEKLLSDGNYTEQNQQKKEANWLDRLKGKGSAGYLNILSSFLHNFFDGFAIGAAFASRSKTQYIPVIVAIFAHQIPREMADVAILMKNNFDGVQTIVCNVVVNCTSLIGAIVGVALGSISEVAQLYILAFVAGNFMYIAADIWRHLLNNKTFWANVLEFLSFALGVGSMYLVLLAENDDE